MRGPNWHDQQQHLFTITITRQHHGRIKHSKNRIRGMEGTRRIRNINIEMKRGYGMRMCDGVKVDEGTWWMKDTNTNGGSDIHT